jgi:hypothetical protein
MNVSFLKNFPIKERLKFQIRVEMFNAFNEANFQNPNAVLGTAAFGTIGATSIDNREIQFGAKLQFLRHEPIVGRPRSRTAARSRRSSM